MRFGLIGKHLSHSFSKRFFEDYFVHNHINAHYDNIELANIADFEAVLARQEYGGFNVTNPYKIEIMDYLTALDETARNEVRKTVEGPVYVFLCFLGCWICFAAGIVVTGTRVLGYSEQDYILIVLLTLVCQIGAHAVFNLCFGHVDSLYVSAWESGESVFAIVLGFIFLGQVPTSWELLGASIVVIGLLYYNYHTALIEKAGAAVGTLTNGDKGARRKEIGKR